MVGHTFISTKDLGLGGLLSHQLTNPVSAPLTSILIFRVYVLSLKLSWIPIYYSPVRHSNLVTIRLACVIPIASIYPVLILNTITFVEV